MKPLKAVVFLLAMLVLTTQAVRHAYVRFIEPRTSVLDIYELTETDKAIKSARSLTDLTSQYEPAKKRVDELDDELKKAEENQTRDEIYVIREKYKAEHEDEYERESDLKSAIQEWEEKSKEILALRVFWTFGLVLFLIGTIMQVRGLAWLGMSLLIPGIIEMIWWTSPSFTFVGSPVEFDRLLINKLVFTLVTIAILVIWWWMIQKADKDQASNKQA